ncbi:MAG TPA: MBL fold metallo-hydrolase [Firmicutes bacterium]|nr:MBL fold metallo-hydrolase [Bacillota bacterium]
MLIKCLAVGELGTNCYIVACERTREAIVVDPGAQPERIMAEVERLGVRCLYIVNTHGHADHIGANGALKRATGARIAIHEKDAPALLSPDVNLARFMWPGAPGFSGPPADILLREGDIVQFGDEQLRVIYTPGHTPGGICLISAPDAGPGRSASPSPEPGPGGVAGIVVFTGDTLFRAGMGRTDFPGGDEEALIQSIEERLFKLPEEARVYPGHGPETTIGAEIRFWGISRSHIGL